jgi:nicotinate-nucleotide adenylyltransferase
MQPPQTRQKLAIFGGTFNPVHWGHLLVAETALDQFALDRVIWVPTYCPAYKPPTDLLSFQHRTEMVRRAIESNPDFSLSTIEQDQPSPSYAVHTLMNLQAIYPNTDWYWIVGLDTFQTLPHWYRHQELVSQCSWLVTPRRKQQTLGNSDREIHNLPSPQSSFLLCQKVAQMLTVESLVPKWHLLNMPLVEISSSLIRQRCRTQHSIRYLVPESVQNYIIQQRLYQENAVAEQAKNDL